MKKLHKIIALFAFIFLAGIMVTLFTINASLNKVETPKETVEIQKDSLVLLNTEKKTV